MTELCIHSKFRTLPIVYSYSFSLILFYIHRIVDNVNQIWLEVMSPWFGDTSVTSVTKLRL